MNQNFQNEKNEQSFRSVIIKKLELKIYKRTTTLLAKYQQQ